MKAVCAAISIYAALTGAAFAFDDRARSAQVVVLGEVHDNPHHHARQAEWVAQIKPRAMVFEMLTPAQAAAITPDLRRDQQQLAEALDWQGSGWPDFAMYYPIFQAAPDARLFGAAVPREAARAVMDQDLAQVFGADAGRFGLTQPLSADQHSAREAMQAEAHCDALPAEMLPVMVQIQRLRDATLARSALDALDQTGGPVVVVTGNGHARNDWGVPYLIAIARPATAVYALGQAEDGAGIRGTFDQVRVSPAVERPDPCEAFRAQPSE